MNGCDLWPRADDAGLARHDPAEDSLRDSAVRVCESIAAGILGD